MLMMDAPLMNGNLPLAITIAVALSPYSNGPASRAGHFVSLHIIACSHLADKQLFVRRCLGTSQLN